ncbi:MAG: PorT family protein [Odoribacter sp.]|nr:PorT family protein [Odoribacter sp.]
MKKLFFVLIAIISFCTVNAQRYEFSFGPKVGLNVTNVSKWDADNKVSFSAGIYNEFRFSELFAFQPELLYSRQGARYKEDGHKTWARVNYLNIPLLARFYVLERLSVDLGPQVGFALNGKYKFKRDGDTHKEKMHHLNRVNVSFAMGLSYDIMDRLNLSAHYNLGLTNVIAKEHFDDEHNKNRVFQLSLAYKWNY